MICPRCGREDVVVGASCPACGAVVVAPDVLDSLLSMPAEQVSEDLDEPPSDVPLLIVEPGSVGPATEVDGDAPAVTSFRDEPSLVDAAGPVREPEAPPGPEPEPREVEAVAPSAPPLPRRTPLTETAAQWGPRPHPPAVPAPPPPQPLDAPAVARVKRPSGTGLPAGIAAGGPAPVPGAPRVPTPPSVSPPVPERPTHPRVRRWFGRGSEPEVVDGPPDEVAVAPAPLEGPFAGAPEGLLEGVVPEADLGPGVRDPGGLDAAMSRLSAGARRSSLAPLGVVATLLEPGEVAEAVVQGDFQHRPAVVVLTDRRVVVANDRRWAPDVRTFGFGDSLVVHGWQDDRRATLVFVVEGVGVVVDAISDRPLARDLAQRVRARCAGGPPGVGPTS